MSVLYALLDHRLASWVVTHLPISYPFRVPPSWNPSKTETDLKTTNGTELWAWADLGSTPLNEKGVQLLS